MKGQSDYRVTQHRSSSVEQGEAVLVETPMGGEAPPSSDDLASAGHPHVIELSLSRTAADCRERWADGATLPVSLAVVEVGPNRSENVSDVSVESVASPEDLTGIGIALSAALDSWAGAEELLVQFDSVSVLLQYVDTRTTFQFLHTVVARLRTVGARSWFYLDPAVHDDQTVATVAAVFDGRLRRVEGTWRRDYSRN